MRTHISALVLQSLILNSAIIQTIWQNMSICVITFFLENPKRSTLTGQCKPKHFECMPGECIPSPWVCDGEEVRYR